jgi:hypothetical protein
MFHPISKITFQQMIFWSLNQKEIILKPRLTQHSPTSHVATATVFDVHPGNVRRGQSNLCKKTEVIVLGAAAFLGSFLG